MILSTWKVLITPASADKSEGAFGFWGLLILWFVGSGETGMTSTQMGP